MARLTVKASLDSTTRRFPVDDKSTFAAFQAQLQTLFSTPEALSVTYNDVDGDLITVSSDIELSELFATAKAATPALARVFLIRPSDPVAPPKISTALPTSSEDSARINSLVSGVSQLLSAIKGDDSAMEIETAPTAQPAATRTADEAPNAPIQSRKRLLSGLRPYMSAFPSGKSGFKKNLKSVSPEVKLAFKKLVRYIANCDSTWKIVSALKDSYPILRTWIVEELGDEGMPTAEKVDRLVAEGEASILPRIGEEATKRIIDFVRLALSDENVVNLLRETRTMGSMPWEEGYKGKGKKAARSAGPKAAKDAPTSASRKQRTSRDANNATEGTEAKKGILSGLKPYLSSFPSGRLGFRKSAKSVSPELKKEIKAVVRYISKSPNRKQIVAALKDAFPILRQFINAELENDGKPDAEKIEAVVNDVRESLLPKAGEEATARVTEVMSKALADDGVLEILRKVRTMGPMPWEKGFKVCMPKVRKGARGFNVHMNTECSNCKTKPIVGSRYKCKNKPDFNLCANCYNNENVSKEGMEFTECKFIWESIVADTNVPPAPLKSGDRGPKVKFLHKVLTDLGFMNEAMYSKRMGFYGPKTFAAVQQFQREQVITEICEDGIYDEATAERLNEVVKNRMAQSQNPEQASEPATVAV